MPVAFLSGITNVKTFVEPKLKLNQICYFGIRSFEPEEEELAKKNNILYFKSEDCTIENLEKIK